MLLNNKYMSGQPYKYAKDVANFRKDYMDALSLRANLDDMNLQANKTYKETGALPPQSQMKDTRLTSEILADTERLKLSIISDLSEVVNSQMAQLVIQRVQQSPLNADGSFLIWLAQNAPELTVNLKKKYKFGVAGDANDAEQMYLFLQTIYTKSKESNTSIKSAFDRPIGNTSGLQPGELTELAEKYNHIQYRLGSKIAPKGSSIAGLLAKINDKFNMVTILTSTDIYKELQELFHETSVGTNSITQMDINNLGYYEWIEFTNKLPSTAALNTLISQLEKSEKNQNPELTIQILTNIYNLFPSDSEIIRTFEMVKDITNSSGQTLQQRGLVPPSVEELKSAKKTLYTPPKNLPLVPTPAPAPALPAVPSTTPKRDTQAKIIMRNFLTNITRFLNDVKNTNVLRNNNDLHDFCIQELISVEDAFDSNMTTWKDVVEYNNNVMMQVLEDVTQGFDLNYTQSQTFDKEYIASVVRFFSNKTGKILGAGLHKRAGRPKGSGLIKPIKERIDKTQGIKQGHTHIQFGKYIINKNKLDDGIFSLKHENGYSVKGHPSTKLNKNLHHVFKTIVGGGQPKYEDLHNLSQEDKTYLHNVSKKSGILDKLNIPVPSKDNLEKDIHKFEVMKGEILAGNDSTELIKQFKILLLRLSKNNTISKREASEIFEDLLSLGY
jgi:hypothetical protein